MILSDATLKYKGYDPRDLKHKSTKRICCSCDECGRVRWVAKQGYRSLCNSCKQIGNKNPMFGVHRYGKDAPNYGKYLSKDHKDKISKSNRNKFKSNIHKINIKNNHADFRGDNNPNWKGGLPLRDHVLPEVQCTKLNKKFNNSEFHHLSKSYGVYIPKELHEHFYHNMKSNQGMDEMSILSFQFIKGEL